MQDFSASTNENSPYPSNHGTIPQTTTSPDSNTSLESDNYSHSYPPPSENYGIQRQRNDQVQSFSARFRQAGGANSIDNFARSWQRAACFPEFLPSFTANGSDDEWATISGEDTSTHNSQQSDQESDSARPLLERDLEAGSDSLISPSRKQRVPSTGIFGTSYDTISSRVSDTTRRNAIQLHREQGAHADVPADYARDQLLVKQVQNEDGTRENVVVGQSTVPQTIFNSVNVLIGVGLLSLPLAMKQAGWLLGLLFLVFAAVTTSYTAKILAKCLDVDRSLITYADLAYISFGHRARLVTSLLFCLELIGACVALVVLFADSLSALIPGLSLLQWKIICGFMLLPLNFVPLRLLSVTSVLGILSCTSIVAIIFIDGLIKPDTPGSLRHPARTTLFPDNWATVPLSFGLIMSPWGGHGVFPNIYRDMRHPQKYEKSLWATYIFTYSLDCAMAVVGWAMFGETILDEVTGNVLLTDQYPQALSICIIIFIAVIPITKVPLNCRPLVATVEVLCGFRPDMTANNHKGLIRRSSTAIIRIFVVLVIVLVAIVFPSFDRIMALMGSALCFTICIILPLAFYLKIFGKEISPRERILDWLLLVTSSILAIVGTIWALLPQELITAK